MIKIGQAALAAAALAAGVLAGCASTHSAARPAPTVTVSTQAPSSSGVAAAAPAATHKPRPQHTITAAQQQAVETAAQYLTDGQGFSRYGLMQQLTSSAGEGFARKDAAFAIRFLHPNWDHQAVLSARGYLSDGSGFSPSGLMQQLTSKAGEGFTEAQAQYAVNKTMG